MQREILFEALKMNIARKRRKRWYKVLSAMAAVVVFVTTYAMILPVITMENEYICGLDEHAHSDSCWYTPLIDTDRRLECPFELHEHEENCFFFDKQICGYADFAVHSHDSACFDDEGILICSIEEHKEHKHTDKCYKEEKHYCCGIEESEGHIHGDGCYSLPQIICGISEQGHIHSEECYGDPILLCSDEGVEGHIHGVECYDMLPLICGQEERMPHVHSKECMSSPELLCQLEESIAHTHSESCGVAIEKVLICSLEEIELHTHEKECFDIFNNLICKKIQVLEHQHSEDCFTEHEHSEDCWQADEGSEAQLICGYHVHGAECRDEEGELVCAEPRMICGLEEHEHSDSCRRQEEEGLAELSFVVPEEYLAYISSELRFPYTVSVSKGSTLADASVLPQISVITEDSAYTQEYHWITADGFPAEDSMLIESDMGFTLRLYPQQEAEKAKLVNISFVYGAESLLKRSVLSGTVISTLIDHDVQQKLDEIKTNTFRFEGWYRIDSEGNEQALEYGLTTAEEDTVYHAKFREYVPVIFHDIDPDGNDYEHSPVEYYVPVGESISQQQKLMLAEGSSVADCRWYKADGEVFAGDVPVAEAMELYTYTYRLSLELGDSEEAEPAEQQEEAQTFALLSFRAAPAADTAQDSGKDEYVAINKREGEPLSEEDFLVDGVDYTDYLWTDPDGNEINADSLVGTSLTSNYAIALAAVQSYTIKYNINISHNNIFG